LRLLRASYSSHPLEGRCANGEPATKGAQGRGLQARALRRGARRALSIHALFSLAAALRRIKAGGCRHRERPKQRFRVRCGTSATKSLHTGDYAD